MPEIIECERLRLRLSPAWVGRSITAIRKPSAGAKFKNYAEGSWDDFYNHLIGNPIREFRRHGKRIWIVLEKGSWHIHLGSTGWFLPANDKAAIASQSSPTETLMAHSLGSQRLLIDFDDGQVWAYFDARTWGKWYGRQTQRIEDEPYFENYGPDWLKQPAHAFDRLLHSKSRRTTKEVLCDQSVSSGLGNYISVEACAHAGIHPHQPYNELSIEERQRLLRGVQNVLVLSNASQDKSYWLVFNRSGQPCQSCNHRIEYVKDRGGSRGSYFCPNCQPVRKK